MRWKLFTLMLLAWPLAFAGPVYKWVDESGVVHYSDQPHENAQLIHLGTPQTYKATNYADPAAAAGAAQQLSYKCAVTSPADQQTFVNVDTIAVGARVDPHDWGEPNGGAPPAVGSIVERVLAAPVGPCGCTPGSVVAIRSALFSTATTGRLAAAIASRSSGLTTSATT